MATKTVVRWSAWYVFASLGFYPVDPLSGRYELVTPLFRESTISLPNGRTLRLSAPELSEKKRYIKRVTINGSELRKSYITYDDVMQGRRDPLHPHRSAG